jgi:hypothetical protein
MNLAQKSTFLPLLKGASFPASREADSSTAFMLSTGTPAAIACARLKRSVASDIIINIA